MHKRGSKFIGKYKYKIMTYGVKFEKKTIKIHSNNSINQEEDKRTSSVLSSYVTQK